jgi:tight adherence protein C
MFIGFNPASLIDLVQAHFAIRVGKMYLGPLDCCVLVLALAAALLSALNLWRIGNGEDREKRLFHVLRRIPLRPADPLRIQRLPWYQRLGTKIASTKIIGTAEQKSLLAALVAAGIKGQGHLAALIAAKFCGGATFVPLCWLVLEWRQWFVGAPTLRLAVLAGASILGWRCPEVILSRLAKRRRVRLENGIPDALDLLVICAEAGLSLDHAIEEVGHTLRASSPEVAKEFSATAAEMRVLPVRSHALENLAERAGLPSLRSIVVTLNQSIKFGTSLVESLRILAAEMRAERLARFEQRAARLPVLLTVPLMLFVMPSLMIVIGTPLMLRVVDMLARVR